MSISADPHRPVLAASTQAEPPPGANQAPSGSVEVVLQGGPADLPDDLRRYRISGEEKKVKVPHYGGYEHFERVSAETDGTGPVVFHWTGRTRVAE